MMIRLQQAPRVKAVHFKLWHGSGKGRCVLLHLLERRGHLFLNTMLEHRQGQRQRITFFGARSVSQYKVSSYRDNHDDEER